MTQTVEITTTETSIVVRSPYHADFPRAARSLDGDWDAYARTWIFPASQEGSVRQLCLDTFGTDGRTSDQVTLRVKWTEDAWILAKDLTIAGVQVARIFSNKSGAKFPKCVNVVAGEITSDGSRKKPHIAIESDTIIEIRGVARKAVSDLDVDGASIEII
jgi:hypothetical protein